jgi:hypothetical protein
MTTKLADVTKDMKADAPEKISAVELAEYNELLRSQILEQEVERNERDVERTDEYHDRDMDQAPIHLALDAIRTLGELRGGVTTSSCVCGNTALVEAIDAKLIELIAVIDLEDAEEADDTYEGVE